MRATLCPWTNHSGPSEWLRHFLMMNGLKKNLYFCLTIPQHSILKKSSALNKVNSLENWSRGLVNLEGFLFDWWAKFEIFNIPIMGNFHIDSNGNFVGRQKSPNNFVYLVSSDCLKVQVMFLIFLLFMPQCFGEEFEISDAEGIWF